MKYKTGLFITIFILLIAVALVFIPAYLIHPFKAQTKDAVRISFYARTWAPMLTTLLLAAVLFVSYRVWRNANRWFKRAVLVFLVFVVGTATWFSFQNYYEWMFQPLPDPNYARADKVDFISGNDMVLTVAGGGEAVAYPVRLLAYHHLVHDRVGGKPIVATY